MARNVDMQFYSTFDFLPELAVFTASYTVKKTFTRHTTPPRHIKNSIRFFFHNVFDLPGSAGRKGKTAPVSKPPYVRVFPSALPHVSVFKKDTHVKVVSVFIDADYLKRFLKDDASHFPFLFDSGNNFLIEEIMTDNIIRTVNDIVKTDGPVALRSYHYKLKAMELLFYLFESLSKRERSPHKTLSGQDISAIYKVRDRLVASLDKPGTIKELKQVAGMNELKMRKIFTQVFGMGIYDYYQHVRMKEAARLLRNENLSVAEVGYQMGFENLSHFSRMFEKHIGTKPKKYSKESMSGYSGT